MHVIMKIGKLLKQDLQMTKWFITGVLVLLSSLLMGQSMDLGQRTNLELRYRINKKSNVDFSYRLDLKDNMSQFRRSNFSFSYDRKVLKWLNYQLYYRFITNNKQDEHRFRAAISADKKIYRKTKLEFRTLLQHDINYFDGDYLRSYKPQYVWRNKIKLSRKLTKRWAAQLYTEPFISQNHKGFHPYRIRTGTSLSFEKKRWKYSIEYFYQQEFFFETSGLHVIDVAIRYDLTRLIRPKKKNKKSKK